VILTPDTFFLDEKYHINGGVPVPQNDSHQASSSYVRRPVSLMRSCVGSVFHLVSNGVFGSCFLSAASEEHGVLSNQCNLLRIP
jgi:hypothetical protein